MEVSLNDALGVKSKNKYTQVVSLLFNARTNAHIAHLQTNSYAQHKALDEFYSGVLDLADKFAESAQGTQGILTGYDLGKLNPGDIISFLKSNMSELLMFKTKFNPSKEGHLIQLIDDMVELYTSTLYKLTQLK